MRYQVPQFIDVEDKIIGPLSFAQFLYVGGGFGLGYLAYSYLPSVVALPLGLAAIGLGFALAFWKINNKPFIEILQAVFRFSFGSRLYVWKKTPKKEGEETPNDEDLEVDTEKDISSKKLKDLAWSLDIHDRDLTNEDL